MSRPRKIRAVVFDFDGVIVDTELPTYRSWCEAFTAHGCEPLTLEEWALQVGTVQGIDIVGELQSRASVAVDVEEMQRTRRARREAMLEHEPLRPGVASWLDEIAAMQLPAAVASSSEITWVEPLLTRYALRHRFSFLACFGDGLAAKPEPDTYLAACRALGVAPADALAVEDSPNGIAAAKAAGLTCVAVANPITATFDLSAADVQLESLADRTLASVIESCST